MDIAERIRRKKVKQKVNKQKLWCVANIKPETVAIIKRYAKANGFTMARAIEERFKDI